MSDDVRLNTKNLDHLIKALKESLPRARVGILGSKTVRNNKPSAPSVNHPWSIGVNARKGKIEATTNAAIGAMHEFGTTKMPMRSFLRMPITDKLQKYMEAAGVFDKDALKQVVEEGSVLPWVKRIAVLAEKIVGEAFATGGFGRWAAWKTPGYKNDDNRILVDTRQLRDSITSDVR